MKIAFTYKTKGTRSLPVVRPLFQANQDFYNCTWTSMYGCWSLDSKSLHVLYITKNLVISTILPRKPKTENIKSWKLKPENIKKILYNQSLYLWGRHWRLRQLCEWILTELCPSLIPRIDFALVSCYHYQTVIKFCRSLITFLLSSLSLLYRQHNLTQSNPFLL